MRDAFGPIRAALAACRQAGWAPRIWWRDDDAIQPTNALDHLLRLAEETVPVHLAVIPQRAEDSLATRLAGAPAVPLVHGWAHLDHSPADAKKSEFGQARPGALPELQAAGARFAQLFPQAPLVFVPPWNRIDPHLVARLPDLGYVGLSTFGARKARFAAQGLLQVNTHIDPIAWKGSRDLVPIEALAALCAEALHHQLETRHGDPEPIGLLTHHLVHTDRVWAFVQTWLHEMLDGGAVPARDIWEH